MNNNTGSMSELDKIFMKYGLKNRQRKKQEQSQTDAGRISELFKESYKK